jgi:hypothetical protein
VQVIHIFEQNLTSFEKIEIFDPHMRLAQWTKSLSSFSISDCLFFLITLSRHLRISSLPISLSFLWVGSQREMNHSPEEIYPFMGEKLGSG